MNAETTRTEQREASDLLIPGDGAATKVRICFVISRIETTRAGTEGHLLRLINALRQRNYEPSLVVLQQSGWTDETIIDGVPLHVLGFRSFKRPRDWYSIVRLASLFKTIRPDVVELYSTDAHFAGAIAARLARVPVTLSCRRDLGFQYGKKEIWLSRFGNRFVDKLIANSSAVADRISKIEGVSRDKFEIIYNGIDLNDFDRQSRMPVSSKFETIAKGKQVICLAANLWPIKNIRLFIDVARQISNVRDDAVFVILGSGPERQELCEYAASMQMADRILWQGSVPAIAPYLVRSNIACLTSNSEGFSNSVVEYMAAGTPVVATRVGGLPEAIVEGVTGFLTEPNCVQSMTERILQLLSDAELRKTLGRAGRQRVESEFIFDNQIVAYCKLYTQLMQQAGLTVNSNL